MAEVKRDVWGRPIEFILSCLGYAVGLGNVWRFPYICGKNGGGAFMVAYLVMLFVAGLPTFYLEVTLGQFAGVSPHKLFARVCPIFGGIGLAMAAACFTISVYYNMIIAWAVYYLFKSFTLSPLLPWATCGNSWNDEHCLDGKLRVECEAENKTYFDAACHNKSAVNSSFEAKINEWLHGDKAQSPAEQFLHLFVLNSSKGLQQMGWPQIHLLLCLLIAWLFVFGVLCFGIKSSGKVVYFTATFPYFILLVLFVRGVTLDGAADGILFFITPNFSKLAEPTVWVAAASQIFFSLGLALSLNTLSSYNDFNNNALRDTLIVALGNCSTSIFAGFVIFPFIGFIAKNVHPNMVAAERVGNMSASGVGLAFVVYADAVTQMPLSHLWSALFFFMLILLGVDSQIVMVETVVTVIADEWPQLRVPTRKPFVVGAVCSACLLLGVLLTCPGGEYALDMLDSFVGIPLLFVALVELGVVSWVYGFGQFKQDVALMLGKSPPNLFYACVGYPTGMYWWVSWVATAPLLIFLILLAKFISYQPMSAAETYPEWADYAGWSVALFCVVWIPLVAVIKLLRTVACRRDVRLLWTARRDWWQAAERNRRVAPPPLA